MAQILHVNLVKVFNHEIDILRLKITAQGHLETLKNMETRLVKRNFSMLGLPLLSRFCVFFIIIIIISIIKQVYNSSSLVRIVNFVGKKNEVVERAIQFTQF